MNFDAAAVSLLLFATPGVLFVLGLNAGSRYRLLATHQWLQLLTLFIVPGFLLHVGAALLAGAVNGDQSDLIILSMMFRGTTYAGLDREQVLALVREWLLASSLGGVVGYGLIRSVTWGWLPAFGPILYGPVYPFVRGFNQPFVRASVLSSVSHQGAFVIYDGVVRDLCMTSEGRLGWISLLYPARALLEIRTGDAGAEAFTRVPAKVDFLMDDRLGDERDGGSLPDDVLTLEGEDVLNYYLIKLDVTSGRGLKASLAERWRSGSLQLWVLALIVIVLVAVVLASALP